jgi:hypothetical protein
MGTTWITKILVSLLYEYDDNGELCKGAENARITIPNRYGQTYPDGLYANREDKERDVYGIFSRVPDGRNIVDAIFGDFTFDDLGEFYKASTVVQIHVQLLVSNWIYAITILIVMTSRLSIHSDDIALLHCSEPARTEAFFYSFVRKTISAATTIQYRTQPSISGRQGTSRSCASEFERYNVFTASLSRFANGWLGW